MGIPIMSSLFSRLLAVSALVGIAGFSHAAEAKNDLLKDILERGEVRVGVKADYKPWGFRSPSGELVGMEVDMAQGVADTLGVKLKLVPVETANRIQFLEQGKIDLMIATLTDTVERRKALGMIDPVYYSSGTNVLANKSAKIKAWEDLKDKPVCARQGAMQNRLASEQYGVSIIAFLGQAEAMQALQQNRCVAYLSDDSLIQNQLQDKQIAENFEMPLPTKWPLPWAVAVTMSERDGMLGRFLSGMIYHWLATEYLVKLEKKWGIAPSGWLAEQTKIFADTVKQPQ
jgi:polar amino acid transport system substrate-binding protein